MRYPHDKSKRVGIFQTLLQISSRMTPAEILIDPGFPRFNLTSDDVIWLYLMYTRKK